MQQKKKWEETSRREMPSGSLFSDPAGERQQLGSLCVCLCVCWGACHEDSMVFEFFER